MINVELHESEAFAKLAEYEASAELNDSGNIAQCINKLKTSLINHIGDVNYYALVQSEEYLKLFGVIRSRINIVRGTGDGLYKNRLRIALQKTYHDEQTAKRRLQRRWFGRGAWALRGA